MKHIFCTTGESAGIGTQITLQAVARILKEVALKSQLQSQQYQNLFFHILADDILTQKLLKALDLEYLKNHPQIIWHFHNTHKPVILGQLQIENGLHSIELLHLAMQKMADVADFEKLDSPHLKFKKHVVNAALVTAPLHKKIVNEALAASITTSIPALQQKPIQIFYGHTEYLAELAQTYGLAENILPVLMFLIGWDHLKQRELRVALATVHNPLTQVAQKMIAKTQGAENSIMAYDLFLIDDALKRFFKIEDALRLGLKVSGINPHAGENGLLGFEELQHIEPLLKIMQKKLPAAKIAGCFSGDTLMMQSADCFYYMQHDQGLAPFKYVTFGQAANITLGLPFIRTSVDHGTALDIADVLNMPTTQQQASPDSMYYAILKAIEMLGF